MTNRYSPGANATIERTEKKTLLVRIGIAGVLIVALIGALALFEQRQMKPEPAPPQSTKSPGLSTGAAQGAPAQGLPNLAGAAIAPPPGEPLPRSDAPAEPERTGARQIAAPATAERPGTGKSVVEPAAPAAAEPTQPRLIVGKGGEPPAVPKAASASPAPVAKPATSESAPIARPTGGRGFLVQVGVFSNLGNAEELRKKLVDAGIPAQIEARVQVGPFATQAEASAAQRKLKSLGMEPGMLLPPRR